jgi:serine/threonine protein kinase
VRKIGSGTYGDVYEAIDLISGETVAIKKVKLAEETNGFPITSIREIEILDKLKTGSGLHRNIVDLREVIEGKKNNSIFLVFEHCNFDLSQLMDNMSNSGHFFSLPQIKLIVL